MIVLDASVILKWFQDEEGSERALVFEERHKTGEEMIAVPDLLFYEIANVLRYQKKITGEFADDAFEALNKLEIQTFVLGLYQLKEVFRFAREYDISVYDAMYVILAKKLECKLITADKRLQQKLKMFSWVVLL